MSTKNDSAIRLVREEMIQESPTNLAEKVVNPSPQQTLRLQEIPQSPSQVAALAAEAANSAKPASPAAATSRRDAETLTTEGRNLRASWHLFQAMLGVMLVISMILAARSALFASIGIAGLLAWKAMENPTWMSLSVSGGFSLLVVVPCVILYWRRG